MEKMQCPNCDGDCLVKKLAAADFDTGQQTFDLVSCPDCGLLWTSPVPGSAELDAYYDAAYYGRGQGKFLPQLEKLLGALARRRARRLLDRLPGKWKSSARVLDVGCGRAVLLKAMAELGADCHGLERPGYIVPVNDVGITMHLGKLDAMDFEPGSFDLVMIWHVLEHLENPGRTLEQLQTLIAPGGLLAIAVPNIGSMQARLFGADWFHLDLPRHLCHFSPESLASLWQPLGLQLLASSGFSLEQNPFGFIQSLMNRLLPGRPNRFYRAMQGDQSISLLAWTVAAFFFAPLAVIESLLFYSVRHGATHTVILRKPD